MFCHKCGTEITNGAEFCHKCGTKVVHIEEQTEAAQPIATVSVQPQPVPVQQNYIPSPQPVVEDCEFQAFIDSRVRATTQYQSAQELLNSKVSQKYVWICFGIPALLFGFMFLRSFSTEAVICTVACTFIIGLLAVRIADLVRISKYSPGFSGTGVIDQEELTHFLNANLKYLEPHFHEWQVKGESNSAAAVGKAITAGVLAGSGAAGRSFIASQQNASPGILALFGEKPRWTIKISLKPDEEKSGQTKYNFVILCHSQFLASREICAAKATPIVKAAMEYYLAHKQKTKEE